MRSRPSLSPLHILTVGSKLSSYPRASWLSFSSQHIPWSVLSQEHLHKVFFLKGPFLLFKFTLLISIPLADFNSILVSLSYFLEGIWGDLKLCCHYHLPPSIFFFCINFWVPSNFCAFSFMQLPPLSLRVLFCTFANKIIHFIEILVFSNLQKLK